MDYTLEEAATYIEETRGFTTKHNIDHTRLCLRRLGSPEKSFQVIHVAGTNGKGSVCAFLDQIYRCAHYRCALFSSPHLVDVRERFLVEGRKASKEAFLDAFREVKRVSVQMEEEGWGHPSFFEFLFLMGMVLFQRAGVSLVLLETGMGGGRDATTAVENPLACVVTSISLDHMAYLGDTIQKIAAEKAGIFVPKVPAIFWADQEEASEVLFARAKELDCPAYPVSKKEAYVYPGYPLRFLWEGQEYTLSFFGRYQAENALLALRTVKVLSSIFPVPKKAVNQGLFLTRWPGRMEQLLPGVFVDGAHNREGVERFIESALELLAGRRAVLLFAAMQDKEVEKMVLLLKEGLRPAKVILTQVEDGRAYPAHLLQELFGEGYHEEDPFRAFALALKEKGEDALLFCVGSLYLVGVIENLVGGMSDD
ncbi:MAG: bifunctional folylpolyglutamate synthase/dihydrofolate synthase [Blautia sp.]|nr:bifunctional folylpolyglutamate synthase/dihydrofolate synthase [Blautia sp.]